MFEIRRVSREPAKALAAGGKLDPSAVYTRRLPSYPAKSGHDLYESLSLILGISRLNWSWALNKGRLSLGNGTIGELSVQDSLTTAAPGL